MQQLGGPMLLLHSSCNSSCNSSCCFQHIYRRKHLHRLRDAPSVPLGGPPRADGVLSTGPSVGAPLGHPLGAPFTTSKAMGIKEAPYTVAELCSLRNSKTQYLFF